MKETRFFLVVFVMTMFWGACSKEDSPVVVNYEKKLIGKWQLKDSIETDSGMWTLSYKLELKQDSTFIYESSESFSNPSSVAIYACPPFDGVWKNSNDSIFFHHRWQGAFSKDDSIRIKMKGADTMISYSKGNLFGAGAWNGYKKEYVWQRIE